MLQGGASRTRAQPGIEPEPQPKLFPSLGSTYREGEHGPCEYVEIAFGSMEGVTVRLEGLEEAVQEMKKRTDPRVFFAKEHA